MANLPHNHTCVVCGNTYYACNDCDQKQMITWRSLCCSPSHFQVYCTLTQWRDKTITKDEAKSLLIAIGIDPKRDVPTFSPSSKALADEIFLVNEDIIIEPVVSVEVEIVPEVKIETKTTKRKSKTET